MEVADRIVVMNRGRIEQIGRPVELYERPTNRFVAEFIGRMNVVRDGEPITIELTGRRDDLAPDTAVAIRIPARAVLRLDDPPP